MVCGQVWLAGLVGLGLLACSSVGPTSPSGSEQEDIVGGQNDSTHQAVFGIVIKNQALCSGTLLAPNLVLTARHCVSDLSTGDNAIDCKQSTFLPKYAASSFVLSYAADLTGKVAQASIFEVSDVRVPGATQFCGNDIALLMLSSNVPSAAVTPIPPRLGPAPQTDEPFTAVGYGLTDPQDSQGTTAGVRHQLGGVAVGCVGAVDCAGTRAKDDEWAANASICHGDSGGPAIDAQGRVIGVASRADTDCTFGLYSSVSPWQSLIVTAALDAADQGGYAPPAWASAGTTGSGGMGGVSSGGSGATGPGATGSGSGGRTSGTGGAAGVAGQTLSDAGTTPPDDGNDAGGLVKPGPELGAECTDRCFGQLRCYSRSGKPPGVCVEPCSAADESCPADSECNTTLNACLPKTAPASGSKPTASASCGCRIGDESAANGSVWPALGVLALCGGMLRRKRRASRGDL